MPIKKIEVNGKTYYQAYICLRSKVVRGLRVQKKYSRIPSEAKAAQIEKEMIRDAAEQLAKAEGRGLNWRQVLERWEMAMRSPHSPEQYAWTTIKDYLSMIEKWTSHWMERSLEELTSGDGRAVMRRMNEEGKSRSYQDRMKHTVNMIIRWAIEERVLKAHVVSPMFGVSPVASKAEPVPDILTLEEIRHLLAEARRLDHSWYPAWAMALLTGMRSGELYALTWSDVDLANEKICVSKSYQTRMRKVKSTKSGAWRTVPISAELKELLIELKAKANSEHVLPRHWKWEQGTQAQELRKFCIGIGIRSVRFHALRACFATQLLAHDIAPATVMKICGWQDLKTMQRYIRMAGIDEKGATQVLKFFPEKKVMGEVVDLFEFRAQKESRPSSHD